MHPVHCLKCYWLLFCMEPQWSTETFQIVSRVVLYSGQTKLWVLKVSSWPLWKAIKNILKWTTVNNISLSKQRCSMHFLFSFLEAYGARRRSSEIKDGFYLHHRFWNALERDQQILPTKETLHCISCFKHFILYFCFTPIW